MFIQENAFEGIVRKIGAILCRSQCVENDAWQSIQGVYLREMNNERKICT